MSDEPSRSPRGDRPRRESSEDRPARDRAPRDRSQRPRQDRPPRDRAPRAEGAREPRERTQGASRRPAPKRDITSPQNNQQLGIILVVVAVVIGVFLLAKGGGDDTNVATGPDTTEAPTDSTPTESTTDESTAVTTPLAELAVVVANGSGKGGIAGATSDILKIGGYSQVTATDATAALAGNTTQATAVYYLEGAQEDALGIAALLGLEATAVVPMPNPAPEISSGLGANRVLVLVGTDFDPTAVGASG